MGQKVSSGQARLSLSQHPTPKNLLQSNTSSSIFTAEYYGILTVLQCIAINRQQKSLVITDSCSVLQAIQSKTFGKHYIQYYQEFCFCITV